MDQITTINTRLKKAGYRNSRIREQILRILHSTPRLSADEITQKLKDHNLHPNKTTVYRQLEILIKEKIISMLDFGELKKRYELNDGQHHHHLFCTRCQKTICVDIGTHLKGIERELSTKYDFDIKDHHLEFFGLCTLCK